MPTATDRKNRACAILDANAATRDEWIGRNIFYYQDHWRYLRFLIPEGARVLDLACGTGRLLAELKPSRGVGIDLSPAMIDIARRNYPNLEFRAGDIEDPDVLAAIQGPYDVIVLSDGIGALDNCEETLGILHRLCHPYTRLILSYYNHLWEPILKLAQRAGLKMPGSEMNWLSTKDIANLLVLADFNVIKREWRQLIPRPAFGLGRPINRFFAPLPGIRHLCLRNYVVARPPFVPADERRPSVSIVIPCRNERGNVEPAIKRIPRFCDDLEIIFVEGHSRDDTWAEILRVKEAYPDHKIVCLRQDGVGKGDAVRKGFEAASGDLLMILDADLTVCPEDLPRFYRAYVSGKGEFINGTRMVYPMESDAMQYLNYFANWTFAHIFSYLLNQRFTDTLCGTKVLSRDAYRRITENRAYFGNFDPFGDFDLIFGAAKLNLKIIEVPVRYMSRTYGSTQIQRFRHGWLLLRMVLFAFFKFKAV